MKYKIFIQFFNYQQEFTGICEEDIVEIKKSFKKKKVFTFWVLDEEYLINFQKAICLKIEPDFLDTTEKTKD